MITREDLQEAIAECQGVRNPTANTCIKLAAFLTIQDYLFGGKPDSAGQSFSESPKPGAVSAYSDSEFSAAINGKKVDEIVPVLDELMQAVSVVSPRLYAATIRKLSEI